VAIRNRYMLRIGLVRWMTELTWPLKQKWFWMLFFVLLATIIGAFVVVLIVVSLWHTSLFLVLIVVLIVWFIYRSYRKWEADKPKEDHGEQER